MSDIRPAGTRRRADRALSAAQIRKAAELYLVHDIAVPDIAYRYGVSRGCVARALNDAGVSLTKVKRI